MIATFYTTDLGTDYWWRSQVPAREVGARLVVIPGEQVMEAFTEPNLHTGFPWVISVTAPDGTVRMFDDPKDWNRFTQGRPKYIAIEAKFLTHEGAAMFTRPAVAQSILAESMKKQGTLTVGEIDDNLLAEPKFNLAMRKLNMDDADRELHLESMLGMDRLVFSTAWLRDRYRKPMKALQKEQPELHVCRNHVAAEDWPTPDPGNGRLRVGFTGGPSHVWDLNLAYGAFVTAKNEGCEVVMVGYNPARPDLGEGERSQASLDYIRKWQGVVDRHVEWAEPDDYHSNALPLDIGLCPLQHNDFTAGKSDIKAIEYTISGAAVVAMNVPVFNSSGWEHEKNCLLANSPYELAEQTQRLIRDRKLRQQLVEEAQGYVREQRGAKQMKREWEAALS